MSRRQLVGVLIATCTALLVTSCSQTLQGKPVSVFDDPFHVAGMPASDGPTGLRPDAEEPTRDVTNGDGGEIDELAAIASARTNAATGQGNAMARVLHSRRTPRQSSIS